MINMTNILLSIQPIHVCNILNLLKKYEVRKHAFKTGDVIWVYCSKPKRKCVVDGNTFYTDDLYKLPNGIIKYGSAIELMTYNTFTKDNFLNGKVVCKFVVGEVEEIQCRTVPYKNAQLGYELFIDNGVYKINTTDKYGYGIVFERNDKHIDSMFKNADLSKMCLTPQELYNYIGLGNNAYAHEITQLEIFDKPKGLNEFYKMPSKKEWNFHTPLIHAPQSFYYVEYHESDR